MKDISFDFQQKFGGGVGGGTFFAQSKTRPTFLLAIKLGKEAQSHMPKNKDLLHLFVRSYVAVSKAKFAENVHFFVCLVLIK